MEINSLYLLAAVGALLLVVYGMAEVALRQADRVMLNLQAQESGPGLTGFLLRQEGQFSLTLQLGVGLGILLLGAGLYGLLAYFLQAQWYLVDSLTIGLAGFVTFLLLWLVLLLVGLVVALLSPLGVLQFMAAPSAFLLMVLYPITYLLGAVLGLISEKEAENEPDLMPNSLALQPFAVKMQTHDEAILGLLPSNELDSKIFNNALLFKTVRVRECMVPRTEIDAIDLKDGVEMLRQKLVDSGHSKILIYQDSIDHILGYCHQFSLFNNPATLEEILTPMEAVPENMLARELFVKFITEHRSIVLVLDEFGGTSGIVTLEDVMEEIIGEINDEYDEEDLLEQTLSEPGAYLFSARQEIDYLNEKYELDLPQGDYETLGGFILSVLEEIPSAGDIIAVPPFEIRILSMDEHRINTVHFACRRTILEE